MNPSESTKREDLSDRELLIRLDERVAWLIRWANGHEKSHARVRAGVIGAIIASVVAGIGAFTDWLLMRR